MTGRVDINAERCEGCGLRPRFCFCAGVRRARARAGLVVIRHYKEVWKTTNSGRLLALVLPGTPLVTWRGRGEPWAGLPPHPGPRALLFPAAPGAPEIAPEALVGRGASVVVLDGTWKQARKMARQIHGLSALPRLSLPPQGAPLEGPLLRRRVVAGGLNTAEAVAALLEALGDADAGAAVREAHALQVARVLESRGVPPEQRAAQLAGSTRGAGIRQGLAGDDRDPQ
jgi:DTW domain-containing protein YfiP